jgi:hypothetical protein
MCSFQAHLIKTLSASLAYAAVPLPAAGGLIRGLGPQLLQDLAGLPLVRSSFPRLHAAMQLALQHFASTQLHTGKPRPAAWPPAQLPPGCFWHMLPCGGGRDTQKGRP